MKPISFASLTLACLLTSCYSSYDESLSANDDEELQTISVNVLTNVWSESGTRADGESAENAYPVHYYLYDVNQDACINTEVISDLTDTNNSVTFALKKGTYKVYALCGNTDNVPSKEDFSLSKYYNFSTNDDVCIGNTENIVVDSYYGDSKQETIMAAHALAQLSFSITDVPSDVKEIIVAVSSFHNQVSMANVANTSTEYSTTKTFVLSQLTDDATKWESASSDSYVYPSSSDVLSVAMTVTYTDGKQKKLNSTCSKTLIAGHKLSLTSTFNILTDASTGVSFKAWETDDDVEVSFGGGTAVTFTDGTQYGTTKSIVLDHTANTVTVMGAVEIASPNTVNSKDYSTMVDFSSAISWSLMTKTQWEVLGTLFDNDCAKLNQALQSVGSSDCVEADKYYKLKDGSNYVYCKFGQSEIWTGTTTAPAQYYFFLVSTISL